MKNPDIFALIGTRIGILDAAEIGAFAMIAKHMWDSGEAQVPRGIAEKIVKRTSDIERPITDMVSGLIRMQVFVLDSSPDGEYIQCPQMVNALKNEMVKRHNRTQAWNERRVRFGGTGHVSVAESKPKSDKADAEVKKPREGRAKPSTDLRTEEDDLEVIASLPCKGGASVDVYASWVKEQQEVYKFIDVKHELLKARSWCQGNPTRQKSSKGVARFLNTWFNNATQSEKTRIHVANAVQQKGNGFGTGGRNIQPADPAVNERDGIDGLGALLGNVPAASATPPAQRRPIPRRGV